MREQPNIQMQQHRKDISTSEDSEDSYFRYERSPTLLKLVTSQPASKEQVAATETRLAEMKEILRMIKDKQEVAEKVKEVKLGGNKDGLRVREVRTMFMKVN